MIIDKKHAVSGACAVSTMVLNAWNGHSCVRVVRRRTQDMFIYNPDFDLTIYVNSVPCCLRHGTEVDYLYILFKSQF